MGMSAQQESSLFALRQMGKKNAINRDKPKNGVGYHKFNSSGG